MRKCSLCGKPGHNKRTCTAPQEAASQNEPTPKLRGALPEIDLVWAYRQDQDVYSTYTRESIVAESPEVDHVFEIQLLDAAYEKYSQDPNIQGITRAERGRTIALANCVENTNVTSRRINRSKKGPFTCAKNALIACDFDHTLCPGIDSYVFTRGGSRRPNKYPGFSTQNWGNIKREVVTSFEQIESAIQNAIHKERNAEAFSDYFREVFLSLRIED